MMEGKNRGIPSMVGSGSLLTVLAVLCLTALTLLALSTVREERKLSDAAARAAADYYAADTQAEAVFARLRLGQQVPGVSYSDGIYCYECVISDTQTLEVALQKTEAGWTVLRWQAVARLPQISDQMDLWDGTEALS